MKPIFLFIPFLFFFSCEGTKNSTNISEIQGSWIVTSKENIESGSIIRYPDSLYSPIIVEILTDSFLLHACDIELGGCSYTWINDQFDIEGLYILEICDLGGWVELVANSISYATSYFINGSEMRLETNEIGKFNLYLEEYEPIE